MDEEKRLHEQKKENIKRKILKHAKIEPLEVGTKIPKVPGRYKSTLLTYAEVTYNDKNYADANLFLPERYDLVDVLIGNRVYSAWWTGFYWEGRYVNSISDVTHWKRRYDRT